MWWRVCGHADGTCLKVLALRRINAPHSYSCRRPLCCSSACRALGLQPDTIYSHCAIFPSAFAYFFISGIWFGEAAGVSALVSGRQCWRWGCGRGPLQGESRRDASIAELKEQHLQHQRYQAPNHRYIPMVYQALIKRHMHTQSGLRR